MGERARVGTTEDDLKKLGLRDRLIQSGGRIKKAYTDGGVPAAIGATVAEVPGVVGQITKDSFVPPIIRENVGNVLEAEAKGLRVAGTTAVTGKAPAQQNSALPRQAGTGSITNEETGDVFSIGPGGKISGVDRDGNAITGPTTPFNKDLTGAGLRAASPYETTFAPGVDQDAQNAFNRTPVHGGTRRRSGIAGFRHESPYGPGGISGSSSGGRSGSLRGLNARAANNIRDNETKLAIARLAAESGGTNPLAAAADIELTKAKTEQANAAAAADKFIKFKVQSGTNEFGEPTYGEIGVNAKGEKLDPTGLLIPPTVDDINMMRSTLDDKVNEKVDTYFNKKYPKGGAPPTEVAKYIALLKKQGKR